MLRERRECKAANSEVVARTDKLACTYCGTWLKEKLKLSSKNFSFQMSKVEYEMYLREGG